MVPDSKDTRHENHDIEGRVRAMRNGTGEGNGRMRMVRAACPVSIRHARRRDHHKAIHAKEGVLRPRLRARFQPITKTRTQNDDTRNLPGLA